jgi:Lrp/AsnC family transcriptional regulator, leucine-responsive regulatory protein
VDQIDQKIIRLLAVEGRMSFADLGRRVNLSSPAVHYRVKQLERRGVITGYGARIDPGALGLGLSALVAVETSGSLDAIEQQVEHFPEVEACWSTAGTSDLLLKVRTADPMSMERLLIRLRELKGVERTRSTVLLATRFERSSDPGAMWPVSEAAQAS